MAGRPAKTPDECKTAMFAHLAALSGYFFPLGQFLGPFAVWVMHKQKSPLVRDQALESLNFQLSLLLYALAGGSLFLIVFIGESSPGIAFVWSGIACYVSLRVFELVVVVRACVMTYRGHRYLYPLNLRLMKRIV